MPKVALSNREATDLVVFLKSLQSKTSYSARRPRVAPPAVRGVERGRQLAERLCSSCHGSELRGGQPNPNSLRGEFPRLDNLRAKLFLDDSNREALSSALLSGLAVEAVANARIRDLPRGELIAVRFESTVNVILDGNAVGRDVEDGATPRDMPAWRHRLEEGELESLLLYMLSLEEPDEDEDPDE